MLLKPKIQFEDTKKERLQNMIVTSYVVINNSAAMKLFYKLPESSLLLLVPLLLCVQGLCMTFGW